MNAYKAKPNDLPWPPIIAGAAILLSVLAGMLITLELPGTALARFAGSLLIISAISLDIWSMMTLHASQTTIMPNRKSSHLVTTGPFGYSRNPIYAGNAMLLFGLGLLTTNGWFAVFAVGAMIGTHVMAIRREELHLLAIFGAEYEAYCNRVRRWV
ncbi:MAG: isoprenylcysteine carboxylmethyltransferase family protein [Rhizobiaceae bacterium]|nr:isoprenylcysteine carboxylmethyltransferase family protein [Rhizobiaceae bacterium]